MKIKSLLAVMAMSAFCSSCVISHTALVTNNPVGSKVGTSGGSMMKKDFDMSFQKAKEEGEISKVGIAEVKITQFFVPKATTTVTGE